MPAKQPMHTAGGKRQFPVHVTAEVVRQIKILVIDRNVSASSPVQEPLPGFLAAIAGPGLSDGDHGGRP